MAITIHRAESPDEILLCYPVMAELRPHLSEANFLSTIERLSATTGFRLAFVLDGSVKAVAGYRVAEWLYSGLYLEIEDLVTTKLERSKGYGGKLLSWLVEEARIAGCSQVRLVSGIKRVDAHRFYERHGMTFEAKYYSLPVNGHAR